MTSSGAQPFWVQAFLSSVFKKYSQADAGPCPPLQALTAAIRAHKAGDEGHSAPHRPTEKQYVGQNQRLAFFGASPSFVFNLQSPWPVQTRVFQTVRGKGLFRGASVISALRVLLAEGVFLNLAASFGIWSRFAGTRLSDGSRDRALCLSCLDPAWRICNLSSLSVPSM